MQRQWAFKASFCSFNSGMMLPVERLLPFSQLHCGLLMFLSQAVVGSEDKVRGWAVLMC